MSVSSITYFKRFRMELDLRSMPSLPHPVLPAGFNWEAWKPELIERHAWVKWESFRSEIDSQVFDCLGHLDGCNRLMREIYNRDTFLANSTWLIRHQDAQSRRVEDCATIQGLAQSGFVGAIQNVGVTPSYRGQGLGRALVLKSIEGFRLAGMNRVTLEVTAQNTPAVDLYVKLGFRVTRTLYKAVEDVLSTY